MSNQDWTKDSFITANSGDEGYRVIIKCSSIGALQAAHRAVIGLRDGAQWSKGKPRRPGWYAVRGFDSAGVEALVCVAENDGELVCNLHDSNSRPVSGYSSLLSECSDDFEWLALSPQPQSRRAL